MEGVGCSAALVSEGVNLESELFTFTIGEPIISCSMVAGTTVSGGSSWVRIIVEMSSHGVMVERVCI